MLHKTFSHVTYRYQEPSPGEGLGVACAAIERAGKTTSFSAKRKGDPIFDDILENATKIIMVLIKGRPRKSLKHE